MDEHERLIVQRVIASTLDWPSVYMGGASRNAMEKADKILKYLERSKRLVTSSCDHAEWRSYKEHGVCCPTCGRKLDKQPGD